MSLLDDLPLPAHSVDIAAMRRLSAQFPSPDLAFVDELALGLTNGSTCPRSFRAYRHHRGAMDHSQAVDDSLASEADLSPPRNLGPLPGPPTWPAVAVPWNVDVKVLPDKTKLRVCTDFSESCAPHSINAGIDLGLEPVHIMARLRNLAAASAIYEAHGLRPHLWGLDLTSAYRQLPRRPSELWQQSRIWSKGWYLDLRAVFGDRSLVHKFTRLSNLICHWLRGRAASRPVRDPDIARFRLSRARALGSAQSLPAWLMMYIDDLLGVSASEAVAADDLADALRLLNDEIGMPTSAPKTIAPTRAADGLGGHIDLDAGTVTLSDAFVDKLHLRTSAVLECESFSRKALETLVYSQAHAALFFPRLKSGLYVSFAFFRKHGGPSTQQSDVSPRFVAFAAEVLQTVAAGPSLPLLPVLAFPPRGDPSRIDIESDAAGTVGYGCILLPPDEVSPVFVFYGKWTAEENRRIHINLKEHVVTFWGATLFADLFPGAYAMEWIDNKVSIAAAVSSKSASAPMREIQRRRSLVHRRSGWVTRQEYIPSKLNTIADALSRDARSDARASLEARGPGLLSRWFEIPVPPDLRDLGWLLDFCAP